MIKGTKNKLIRLGALIQDSKGAVECVFGDTLTEISSVEYNSKKIKNGGLFAAISGFSTDGHSFVGEAVRSGASAVLVSKERVSEFSDLKERGVVLLASDNNRRALSKLSASFFGRPCAAVPVIGVTGTNGKTSITYMLESIFKAHGYSPGVIGTVNYRWKNNEIQASNTTPESRDLQELFSRMVEDGADVIIIEVSSHALKLSRADDIDFDAAIFTNLTRDHLDLHKTFDDYFNSKKILFRLLEESIKKKKSAVVNIDDEYGRMIREDNKKYQYATVSVGVNNSADYGVRPGSIKSSIDGVGYILDGVIKGLNINLDISGGFQVYNSLCAFAASHQFGIPAEEIQKGLSDLKNIPGRFDRIKSSLGFYVIVDYAHTDDALLNVLRSARDLHPGRVITIFGCGGNRDRTKRPLMGKAAAENSDWAIVTSDNPRNERPEDIISDIVKGINSKNYEIQPDRKIAIKKGIDMAEKNDLIVIAGKGHENYQIIGDRHLDFDDRELAGSLIREREMKGNTVESRI
jgi:UDP-N-acetylmuramoyl-L-alanyl-D-glutamate--2,6-diaminopimelate ligase